MQAGQYNTWSKPIGSRSLPLVCFNHVPGLLVHKQTNMTCSSSIETRGMYDAMITDVIRGLRIMDQQSTSKTVGSPALQIT